MTPSTALSRAGASPSADRDPEIVELRDGLLAPLPTLPSKYFYDERGSALFEDITRLPEYYLTRVEEQLLASIADEVADRVRARELVEIGSGAGLKTRLLLDALQRAGTLSSCTLLDISEAPLIESVGTLSIDYPSVRVVGIASDFTRGLTSIGPGGGRLLAFLGSTVGNLAPDEIRAFLAGAAEQLEPGDGFLVGWDLVKDLGVLLRAYDDAAGVTAEFNRNILSVINNRFGADFDPSGFAHVALFDTENSRIEMRLRALRRMRVRIPAAGLTLDFPRGREIRTEISGKFTREQVVHLLAGSGLELDAWHTDPAQQFALSLLRPGERS